MTRSKLGTEAVSDFSFTVPMVPVSVNHYKKPRRFGRGYYVTEEAKAFKQAVAIFSRGQQVSGKRYQLDVVIYLGKGQRGDVDNFAKLVGDSLQAAGVIRNDSAVMVWNMSKGRDAENPRTEIRVRSL